MHSHAGFLLFTIQLCRTLFESSGLILNSYKDCFVLHQGCHTLSNIAQASIQQLMDCSLDQETAKKVYNFFHIPASNRNVAFGLRHGQGGM